MINRRAAFTQLRGNATRAGGVPRFRPIAPKPASAVVANHTSAFGAAAATNPCSKSSRKRSQSNASSSASSPSKRARCSGTRPLIPVTKPSSKSLHFTDKFYCSQQQQQQQPELKTLALLPAAAVGDTRSSSSPSSCQTHCSEDEWSLTELSLATSTSSDRSPASSSSESSGEEEEAAAAAPRPATATPCIDPAAGPEFFEQLYASSSEAMVLSNNRGGILWCNHVYRGSVSRGEELGLPIPIYSCGFGAILWMFSKRNPTAGAGLLSMNLCSSGPLRPQPVRPSTAMN